MSKTEIMQLDGLTLAAFCAVAEELSFARAAHRLCLSQPPLSRRIRQLEQWAGAPLFIRTTRSVSLTPAGAVMYEHASRVCADMAYMLASVREVARGEGGVLSIGMAPSAAQSPLVGMLRTYRLRHPTVELGLREMDSVEMTTALRRGDLDVALMRPVRGLEGFETVTVYEDEFGFVTLPEQGLPGRRATLAQALRHPLIGYDPVVSPYLHGLLAGLLAQADGAVRLVQQSRLPSILTLVEAGVGAAFVPRSMVRHHEDTLVFHGLEGVDCPRARIVLAFSPKTCSPAGRALVGSLAAQGSARA